MQKTTTLVHWIEETYLPLLRTLLAIHQKSWKPSFWEVMDSFVLVAYASLAASRILLQWLLACLNFTLHSENVFYWQKQQQMISMNYASSTSCWKPWRWVRFDLVITMRDIYIHPNQRENSHKLCNEKGILFWGFFLIGIHSIQDWTATTRHGVTRKRRTKKGRKNRQLKDVYQ